MSTLTKITYTITPELQKSEILAGRTGERDRSIDVDLSVFLSHPRIVVDADGSIRLYNRVNCDNCIGEQSTILTQETASAAILHHLELEASADKKEEEEKEQKIVEWIALPDDQKIQLREGKYEYYGDNCLISNDPRVKTERMRLSDICYKMTSDKKAADKEVKKETERKKAETEQRKKEQLSDVVARLGTDIKKQKWAAGLMSHSEAIDLLWSETFPGAALPADEYHLYKIDGYKRQESEKETVSDEQFTNAQKIIETFPGAIATYHHQYYEYGNGNSDNDCDVSETCVVIRITKTVGEYTLEADYIL